MTESSEVANGELFCVRMQNFYIESEHKCPFCEIYVKSESFKILPKFGEYLKDSINFVYIPRPSDWRGLNSKRHTDEEVERADKEGKVLKSWSLEEETKNYLLSAFYTNFKFPSIVLQLFYGGGIYRRHLISSIFLEENETEVSFAFLDYLKSFFSDQASPSMRERMSKDFKHETALMPGSAQLRHELQKEDLIKESSDKYDHLSIEKLEELMKFKDKDLAEGNITTDEYVKFRSYYIKRISKIPRPNLDSKTILSAPSSI